MAKTGNATKPPPASGWEESYGMEQGYESGFSPLESKLLFGSSCFAAAG